MPPKRPSRKIRWLLWLSAALLLLTVGTGAGFYVALQRMAADLPSIEPVLDYRPPMPLRMYSADGGLLAEIGPERRTLLPIEQIPKRVQQAFIAAEDARFYQHDGVDWRGVARAAYANLRARAVVEGASTITQQLARNLFLDADQNFRRKFREALLAREIERYLSKDKILERYLNQIYLGNGAYGVQAAAQRYFNKPLASLPLSQIALLAAMPKAPSAFNPLINPSRAQQRRDYVLERMVMLGYATRAEADQARAEPLGAGRYRQSDDIAPYVTELIRQWLVSQFGEEQAYSSGLQVYTTLSGKDQIAAQRALMGGLERYERRHAYRGPIAHLDEAGLQELLAGKLPQGVPAFTPTDLHWAAVVAITRQGAQLRLDNGQTVRLPFGAMRWARRVIPGKGLSALPKKPGDVLRTGDLVWLRQSPQGWLLTQIPEVQGGLVSLEANSGRILALAGGYSFDLNQYNHVTQAKRQAGSAFKPFIYAAAMDGDALTEAGVPAGFTPASVLDDAPFEAVDGTGNLWRPENFDGEYYGPTRLRLALARSQNMVSIRLLQAIGMPYAIDYLKRFGFTGISGEDVGLSLALGSLSVTLLDMTSAYSVFASSGFRPSPYLIEKVLDDRGQPIVLPNCPWCKKPRPTATVVPPAIAFLTASMMQDVTRIGTAAAASTLQRPDIAGKTGTTNDSKDTWFIGFTPQLVAGVWVGYDQPRSLGRRETGSMVALPVWMDFMRDALRGRPPAEYRQPPDVVTWPINPAAGTYQASGGISEYFQENHPPAGAPTPTPAAAPETNAVEDLSDPEASVYQPPT